MMSRCVALVFVASFLLLKITPLVNATGNTEHEKSIVTRTLSGLGVGVEWMTMLLGLAKSTRPSPRPFRVLVAGLGRTGSTSLAAVLKELGYSTLHDDEMPNVADLIGSYYANNITVAELHAGFGQRGYDASFNYNFYPWAATDDNIKFILSLRDTPEKWVESWLAIADFPDLMESPPFCWDPNIQKLLPLIHEQHKIVPTGGNEEGYKDYETLRKGYIKHLEAVRAAIPPE